MTEERWRKEWEKARLFEPEIENRKKFFINIPYPYLNGAPHMGHAYSFVRCDILARYKRMQGFNVLFPQGFHVTGEPLMGAIKRLNAGDQIQIEIFKDFGASDKDIEKMKKDVKYAVEFWKKKWIDTLKMFGMSIDWRRTFNTSSLDPYYSKFIEWQYKTLRKMNLVKQGTHPVVWCPRDQSPTGDHDRLEGEGESPIEYTIYKFQSDNLIFPCGTLRPETIYGVTNIWINPEANYVIAQVDSEKWVVSDYSLKKLEDQLKRVKVIERMRGKELVNRTCKNPVTGKIIPVLPAKFVNPENTTGVVMSVPAHAPYDYMALKDLKSKIEPISLISVDNLGEFPAIFITDKMEIKNQSDPKLEEATKAVYKKEFYEGVLKEITGRYAGMKVSEAKDGMIIEFSKKGLITSMWDLTGKVVCRCTTVNHVKILENQWFLAYSDEKWKRKTLDLLESMKLYPKDVKSQMINTIEWLRDKACARKSGLGTPLPWDEDWIVETLSDSTIYMAYYTIAHLIRQLDLKDVNDDLFDAIFLGKSRTKNKISEKMKREFDYWYPVDLRTTGKDNLQNHIIFYLFHHTALFPRSKLPKAIAINGYVNIEGEKMSKSKGNIIPLKNAIERFGADITRINIGASAEGLDDADWRIENTNSYKQRLDFISSFIKGIKKFEKEKRFIDKYLESVIQDSIKRSVKSYENLNFRTVINESLFKITNSLKWYATRGGNNREVVVYSLETLLKLITPIVPHFCEDMWRQLGHKDFISTEKFPEHNPKMENVKAEAAEELVRSVVSDIEQIRKISGIKEPIKISIFVAPSWKFDVWNEFYEKVSLEEVLIKTKFKSMKKEVAEYYNKLRKRNVHDELLLNSTAEHDALQDAKDFIEKQFRTKVEILSANKVKDPKALTAEPNKPGIMIE